MAKTTAVKDQHGDPIMVGTGAVNQTGGTRKLYRCNECGAEVVWVESRKTGKFYLANVHRGFIGQRYYIGADVHECPTGPTFSDMQERGAKMTDLVAKIQAAKTAGDEETVQRLFQEMATVVATTTTD